MNKKNQAAAFFSADRIAALLLLLVVALYGWEGAKLTAALQVDVIGPGFFPKILTAIGVMLGVLLFIRRSPREGDDKNAAKQGSDLVALAPLAFLLAYVLALEPVGFPLATAAFLAITFRYLGHPTWKGALFHAVVITAVVFGLFHFGLDIKLPLGVLAGWA